VSNLPSGLLFDLCCGKGGGLAEIFPEITPKKKKVIPKRGGLSTIKAGLSTENNPILRGD